MTAENAINKLKPSIHVEANGLDYVLAGDYYIPAIDLPEDDDRPIGKWGRMHRAYLEETNPLLLNHLILTGRLHTHLAYLDEQEQTALLQSIMQAESALDSFEQDTANVERFLALAKKYTDFSELTTPMINEFIEKIVVHAPDRSEGDRVQEVDIYLKYIGKFETPVPEPTTEEIAEQECLKKERIRSRERYQRMKVWLVWKKPAEMVCHGCGKVFISGTATAMFCSAACRQRARRRETREAQE